MADEIEVRGMRAGRAPFMYSLRAMLAARGEPIPIAERRVGIDTSHWDGQMNWATAYNAGARFAYFKASQGTTIADIQFPISRQNCTTMPWGAYHFLTTADGVVQANWFIQTLGANRGDLPPVLDVELASVPGSTVKAFCNRVFNVIGEFPMIYTSGYFWAMVTGATEKAWVSARCPLWVAHWDTTSPILPYGWTTYAVHQYSADGNNLGPTYGGQSDDMDLNYTRQSWIDGYWMPPALTIEQRLTKLEEEARRQGWSV